MEPRFVAIAVGFATCLCVAPSLAQKIYRWTDQKGVVHFGHAPPNDYTAEEHKLPRHNPIAKKPTPAESAAATAPAGADISEKATDGAAQAADPSSQAGDAQPAKAAAENEQAQTDRAR